MDAFLLTGIHDTLPPDSAGPFIILSNDIGVARQYGYDRILPEPTAVVGIVNHLAILHVLIIAEILLL